jgi:hypothetical protein
MSAAPSAAAGRRPRSGRRRRGPGTDSPACPRRRSRRRPGAYAVRGSPRSARGRRSTRAAPPASRSVAGDPPSAGRGASPRPGADRSITGNANPQAGKVRGDSFSGMSRPASTSCRGRFPIMRPDTVGRGHGRGRRPFRRPPRRRRAAGRRSGVAPRAHGGPARRPVRPALAGHPERPDDEPAGRLRHAGRHDADPTAGPAAAARVLVGAGMAPSRLSVTGYAGARPLRSEPTAEARAANRRVEIVVTPRP